MSTLSGNTPAHRGGAMVNLGGTVVPLHGTTVRQPDPVCRAAEIGNNGGITLTGSTISGNTTSFSGGGIYNHPSGTLDTVRRHGQRQHGRRRPRRHLRQIRDCDAGGQHGHRKPVRQLRAGRQRRRLHRLAQAMSHGARRTRRGPAYGAVPAQGGSPLITGGASPCGTVVNRTGADLTVRRG
jgi:hypothetical protein